MDDWDKGISDLAYIAHMWMHYEWLGEPCQLCARYPLPPDMKERLDKEVQQRQDDKRGFTEGTVIEVDDDL